MTKVVFKHPKLTFYQTEVISSFNTETTYTKINSKWIKDLNVRPETIKLLEENKGSKLSDISLSNISLDMSLQAREMKAKITKWDCI